MKCTNCGQPINGKSCLNCGALNDYKYVNIEKKYTNNKKTNRNSKLNIKSILIMVLCLIIIGGIVGGIVYFTRPKKINVVLKYNASEMIDKDFKESKISVNQYVLYSAYSIYDYKKLPKKYQTNTFQFSPDISSMYTEYYSELDDQTKEYLEEKIYLKNLRLGPKEKGVSYIPLVDKVEAAEGSELIQLDKAYASNNTLIWYTTEGKDSIDENTVKSIANNIDKAIQDIENAYGIKYQFKNQYQLNEENRKKREDLLKQLNISSDYMNKLNIYLYNYGNESKASGTYIIGSCFDDNKKTVKCDLGKVSDDLVMVPYISLNTNSIKTKENLEVFYTHELYHHFQYTISSNGNFDFPYPKSNDNNNQWFTSETTANHAASLLNPNVVDRSINNYLNNQILDSSMNIENSINKISGYTSFRFLEDYSNTIENGRSIIRDSILYEDRIKYFEEQAKGNLGNVVANYGLNNLTNNYNMDSFKSYIINDKSIEGNVIPVRNNCIKSDCKSISPVSVNYYRIKLSDYKKEEYIKIKSKDIDNLKVQFVSVKNQVITEYVDGATDNLYIVYNSTYDKKTDVFNLNKDSYIETSFNNYKDDEALFVIISNGSISQSGNYEMIINDKKEGTNEDNTTSAKEGNVAIKKEETKQVPTKIYLNDKNLDIESFNYNWRTYVKLEDFCEKIGCNVSNDGNKKIITRDITSEKSSATGTYKIELDLKSSYYNSKLILNNNENDFWNLVQDNITDKACPEDKDQYGVEPKKLCTDNETYVPIRFIMQGLGYIVDWKPEDSENKVLFYDNVLEDFEKNKYRFVFSIDKVDVEDIVKTPLEIKNEAITLKKDTKYYIYLVDENNKRMFKSSLGFIDPINDKETNIGKYFKKDYSDSDNYGIVSTGNIGEKENIVVVGNYEIKKDAEHEFRTENVNYPIYYEISTIIGE